VPSRIDVFEYLPSNVDLPTYVPSRVTPQP
jgi:hypothetical protein